MILLWELAKQHSVKEFIETAFSYVGLDWEEYVKIDERYFRPTETENLSCRSQEKSLNPLVGNLKVRFVNLVKIMMDAEMRKIGLKPLARETNF